MFSHVSIFCVLPSPHLGSHCPSFIKRRNTDKYILIVVSTLVGRIQFNRINLVGPNSRMPPLRQSSRSVLPRSHGPTSHHTCSLDHFIPDARLSCGAATSERMSTHVFRLIIEPPDYIRTSGIIYTAIVKSSDLDA